MKRLVGIHYVLSVMPTWAVAFAGFVVLDGAIYAGRDYFEGLPYQVAYSAQIGDAALMVAVLITTTILHRENLVVPLWLQRCSHQLFALVLSVLAGVMLCACTRGTRSTHVVDVFHDVIVGPLVFFLGLTLLPIIALNGTRSERSSTLICIFLWAGLVAFDFQSGRIDQRDWLRNHGVTFRH